MKKLLSVVLALLMLAVMLPVVSLADDTLPAAPTMNGNEWTVTPDNAQATLDGAYGSIDGKTIILSAGTYGRLELGRATAYEGSNTKYYLNDSETTVGAIKQAIAAHPQGGAGTPVYVRSMSNVTLKAADNATVTINGLVAFGGQVNSTKWYSKDFVADRVAENNNTSYYINQKWNNITFEGLTFTGGVNIEAYQGNTLIDNVKFDRCKFNVSDTDTNKANCIRLNVDGNQAKANNLVVTKCEFTDGYTAVLTDGMPNVTVTGSTFSGLTKHAINPMMNYLPKAPGYGKITVTGNTFKNMSSDSSGTILRMGEVGAGAVLTIQNNTATEGITLANSVKVNSLADGITYNISGNNWRENLKFSEAFKNIVDEPIPEPSAPIVIITPTEDTPKTEPEKNPTTGANDMVAAAVALMAVSALGMAVLSRKK
mgnify:CR=1 FL=1